MIETNGTAWNNNEDANIPTSIPKTAVTNPIIKLLGANANNAGTSSAGIAPGTSLSEIPLNAGTNSPKNILTPCN